MMFLIVGILIVGYPIAASWASTHGPSRLWLTAAASLVLIVVATALLGRHFAVPSLSRLLLYVLALTGPIVFIPTAILSFRSRTTSKLTAALPGAIVGACVGFAFGFVIVVFGLRVW